jgi:hypothetical protein
MKDEKRKASFEPAGVKNSRWTKIAHSKIAVLKLTPPSKRRIVPSERSQGRAVTHDFEEGRCVWQARSESWRHDSPESVRNDSAV